MPRRPVARRDRSNLETHVECVPRPRQWGGFRTTKPAKMPLFYSGANTESMDDISRAIMTMAHAGSESPFGLVRRHASLTWRFLTLPIEPYLRCRWFRYRTSLICCDLQGANTRSYLRRERPDCKHSRSNRAPALASHRASLVERCRMGRNPLLRLRFALEQVQRSASSCFFPPGEPMGGLSGAHLIVPINESCEMLSLYFLARVATALPYWDCNSGVTEVV